MDPSLTVAGCVLGVIELSKASTRLIAIAGPHKYNRG